MEYNIEPKKDGVRIFFHVLWLSFWVFGEFNAINLIVNEYQTTIVFLGISIWLILWTAAGIGVFVMLLWILWGKEIVQVTNDELSVKKSYSGLK